MYWTTVKFTIPRAYLRCLGAVDPNAPGGEARIVKEGIIEHRKESEVHLYWSVGERTDGSLVLYVPGLTDRQMEVTKKQIERQTSLRELVVAVANTGGVA